MRGRASAPRGGNPRSRQGERIAQAHDHIVRHGVGIGRVFDVGVRRQFRCDDATADGSGTRRSPTTPNRGDDRGHRRRHDRGRRPPRRLRTRTEDTVPSTEAAATDVPAGDRRSGAGSHRHAIKVGVVYLDLSSAGPILGINQGDWQAAYQAAFDTVNEAGGVNGRTLEPVFTPIVPASADQGTAACTTLTEDESVFVVLGNYVDENAPCIVTTNQTPLLGGDLAMNDETLGAGEALWYATGGGSDAQTAGLQALVDEGRLDGNVGGRRPAIEQPFVEAVIAPALDAAGINVVRRH